MAEGSELSSLPARLSPCKGMLAHITLRNALSNIFPAGLHSSTQHIHTAHIHTSSSHAHTHKTHFSPVKEISVRCVPCLYALINLPFSCLLVHLYANVSVCVCVCVHVFLCY